VAELATQVEINPFVLVYLNRLSDFFFVASRCVLVQADRAEVAWRKQGGLGGLGL
jgi:cob(I)alamin adenosyltransferase